MYLRFRVIIFIIPTFHLLISCRFFPSTFLVRHNTQSRSAGVHIKNWKSTRRFRKNLRHESKIRFDLERNCARRWESDVKGSKGEKCGLSALQCVHKFGKGFATIFKMHLEKKGGFKRGKDFL